MTLIEDSEVYPILDADCSILGAVDQQIGTPLFFEVHMRITDFIPIGHDGFPFMIEDSFKFFDSGPSHPLRSLMGTHMHSHKFRKIMDRLILEKAGYIKLAEAEDQTKFHHRPGFRTAINLAIRELF